MEYRHEMEIEPKEILEGGFKKYSDRSRKSVYLSDALFDRFRDFCGDASASAVLEVLMEKFIESVPKKKGKK